MNKSFKISFIVAALWMFSHPAWAEREDPYSPHRFGVKIWYGLPIGTLVNDIEGKVASRNGEEKDLNITCSFPLDLRPFYSYKFSKRWAVEGTLIVGKNQAMTELEKRDDKGKSKWTYNRIGIAPKVLYQKKNFFFSMGSEFTYLVKAKYEGKDRKKEKLNTTIYNLLKEPNLGKFGFRPVFEIGYEFSFGLLLSTEFALDVAALTRVASAANGPDDKGEEPNEKAKLAASQVACQPQLLFMWNIGYDFGRLL